MFEKRDLVLFFMVLVAVVAQQADITSPEWYNGAADSEGSTFLGGNVYLANGFHIKYKGDCKGHAEKPQVASISLLGHNLELVSPSDVSETFSVDGYALSHHNVTLACPSDSYIAGIDYYWDALKSCGSDAASLWPLTIICKTPVGSGSFGPAHSNNVIKMDIGFTPGSSGEGGGYTFPEGYFLEGLTVRTSSTCKGKCKTSILQSQIALPHISFDDKSLEKFAEA